MDEFGFWEDAPSPSKSEEAVLSPLPGAPPPSSPRNVFRVKDTFFVRFYGWI